MTSESEYANHLRNALAPLGDIRVRRMFGGAGLFLEDTMFGLISEDSLFLKADDENRPDFEAEGLQPITYERLGRTIALSYWEAPEHLLDDPDALLRWSRRAWQAARRSAAGKSKRRRPKRKAQRK